MQYYNFINFVNIVDLSLLNFVDYYEVIDGNYEMVDGKILITLNAKNKKLLTAFIINNINAAIQYNKINVIVNTCKPMLNWRKEQRIHAVRSYKYILKDDSIYIDILKLNQFLDQLFEKLPKYNLNKLNQFVQDIQANKFIKKLNLENNVIFINLQELDITDASLLFFKLLSNIGNLTFNIQNYNIIEDGNCVYKHNLSFPDEIYNNVRLQFLQKGLI